MSSPKSGWAIPPTEPRYPRAWKLLEDAIGPVDRTTEAGQWAIQVHNEAEQLIEELRDYANSPAPSRWVDIDELMTSLSDLLAGTLIG